MKDCIQIYTDESQNKLDLLDSLLSTVYILQSTIQQNILPSEWCTIETL